MSHAPIRSLLQGATLALAVLTITANLQAADRPVPAAARSIPGYEPTTDPHDLSGLWKANRVQGLLLPFFLGNNLPFTPQAKARADHALAMSAKGTQLATPHIMCRPTGVNQATGPIAPIYVLQNKDKLAFVVTDEIRNIQQVYFTDKHPANLQPSYGGHSIAHWEGDVLVIDTVGYNGRGVLENAVHSPAMHMTQRIRKSADGKSLSIDITLDDPATFTQPLQVHREWSWVNGQQPIEFDCEENPREDNFSGMVFEDEYLRPVCIQHEGKDEELSKVVCDAPKPARR